MTLIPEQEPEDRPQTRGEQLAVVLHALAETPGIGAYTVSLALKPAPPAVGQLRNRHVSITLVLSLLAELAKQGKVCRVPDPGGARFYLAGQRP